MSDPDKDQASSEAVQDTAVIAVVIAGVLASFTIPGPFDWGATLIGVILLVVLIAYGNVPWEPLAWRRAMGMAAAAAFCVLQIIGRPLDRVVYPTTLDDCKSDSVPKCHHRLSGWPYPEITRDDDIPNPNAGLELLKLWLSLFLLFMSIWLVMQFIVWWLRNRPKGTATTPGDGHLRNSAESSVAPAASTAIDTAKEPDDGRSPPAQADSA